MLSIVISVRDREKWRIQQCVDNFNHEMIDKVYIVDYGSKNPVKGIKNAEVLRYKREEYPIWNKSHALNLGIKECESDWIATVDVDMILATYFLNNLSNLISSLKHDCFLYTTNVKRSDKRTGSIQQRWRWAKEWFPKGQYPIKVDGGMQIFTRDWIHSVKGYDENLIYWGGPDNDLHHRALYDNIITIDTNFPILHQEHDKQKENQLSDQEKKFAFFAKRGRPQYLANKEINRIVKNPSWGEKKPSCKFTELPKEAMPSDMDQMVNFIKTGNYTQEELEAKLKKITKNKSISVTWPNKK